MDTQGLDFFEIDNAVRERYTDEEKIKVRTKFRRYHGASE